MTAETALIIVTALLFCAIFVALHYAAQATFYQKKYERMMPKRGARGRWVAK